MGGADPGSAEPDDPMAHARHGMASFVAFQRRPAPADAIMSSADTRRQGRAGGTARPVRHGDRSGRQAPVLRKNWPALAFLGAGLALRGLGQFAYRPATFYMRTPR